MHPIRYQVGAAVLLENGEIYTGNNQENAAYPSGLCAERVAIFYAGAQHPDVAVVIYRHCCHTLMESSRTILYHPVGGAGRYFMKRSPRGEAPWR